MRRHTSTRATCWEVVIVDICNIEGAVYALPAFQSPAYWVFEEPHDMAQRKHFRRGPEGFSLRYDMGVFKKRGNVAPTLRRLLQYCDCPWPTTTNSHHVAGLLFALLLQKQEHKL